MSSIKALAAVIASLVVLASLAGPAYAQEKQSKSDSPRVLMLLADGFNHSEFAWPYGVMRAVGYEVDVASFEKGVVKTGNKGRTDAQANLTFDDVKIDDYFALMIPGGKSPAELIKSDKAVAIAKAFVDQGKPVAAICHGPLVLMESGVMRDRAGTALWSVKDDFPQLWNDGAIGNYLDQPVVLDSKVMTGRHVADVAIFVPRMLAFFESEGGIELPARVTQPLVIYPGATGHLKWEWSQMIGSTGIETQLVTDEKGLSDDALPEQFDALAIFGEREAVKELLSKDKAAALVVQAKQGSRPVVLSPGAAALLKDWQVDAGDAQIVDGREEVKMAAVFAKVRDVAEREVAAADAGNGTVEDLPVAVIAVEGGFDERVALGVESILEFQGYRVVYVSEKAGWKTGVGGIRVDTKAFDSDDAKQAKVIVGPGVVTPLEGEPDQTPRVKWMLGQYNAGKTLLVFGYDSLGIGRHEQFKGSKFACSGQAVWNFGKTGGKYSREAALVSADRLVTGKGADEVAPAVKLLLPLLEPAE